MFTDTNKRPNDNYQDPFEKHRLQCEANIKRMKKEKKLNVVSGKALNSGTTPTTLNHPEIFKKRILKDTTNMNNVRHKKDVPFHDDQVKNSNVTITSLRDSIMEMHRQPAIEKPLQNNPKKISIFELSSIIRNSSFTKYVKHGFNDRYLKITIELLNYIPHNNNNKRDRGSIVLQANEYMRNFIDWFKINKFDYLIVDKMDTLRLRFDDKQNVIAQNQKDKGVIECQYENDEKIVQKLSRQRYLRETYRNEMKPNPTHIVESYNKVGKFIISTKVKNIFTGKTEVVLLLQADVRFAVKKGNLLVLHQKSCYNQRINNKPTSVYVNWFIYKEKPLDIDFFNQLH